MRYDPVMNVKNKRILVTAGLVAALSSSVEATFHFMQIEQAIGGVNGDTTAQAIQLRMRSNSQNLLGGAKLWVRDATGSRPVLLIDFATSVPNGAAGARVLIASPSFTTTTTPITIPDFTLTNLIPVRYLAAGSMTFENNSGSQIYWRLSWGNASYTGSNLGSCINDDSVCPAAGDFGPAWPGPLPSGGVEALQFQGAFNAVSTNNAADYALTAGPSTWINNAGESFVLPASAPCPWDCEPDPDGNVGITDFLALIGQWGQVGSPCDFGGGGVGITAFLDLLANWGPCP